MDERLTRLEPLLTNEGLQKLRDLRVAVVGLGGVGGTALEALARSGVGHFLLIDHDVVQASNLNRQIMYLKSDIGEPKVAIARKRIRLIDPDIEVVNQQIFINETTIACFDEWKPDFIIDAIDSIQGKTSLLVWANHHHCPIISSLGMGNRLDPNQIKITTLGQTSHDPLAKVLRNELRKHRLELNQIPVVFSSETPLIKSQPIASLMTVTSKAGLLLAHYLLATIRKR